MCCWATATPAPCHRIRRRRNRALRRAFRATVVFWVWRHPVLSVFKFNWVGKPNTKPDVQVLHNKEDNTTNLYVSWNGATEVDKWVLEGADEVGDKGWETVEELSKEGFETTFSIGSDSLTYVRVKGLDHSGNVLGESVLWNWKQLE